jgi:hypothetical protein
MHSSRNATHGMQLTECNSRNATHGMQLAGELSRYSGQTIVLPSDAFLRNAKSGEQNTLHFAFCTLHFAPCTLHPALCTLHSALCTLHFALCTLHPALCTLHSAFCSLHSALCILHFALTTSSTHFSQMMNWRSFNLGKIGKQWPFVAIICEKAQGKTQKFWFRSATHLVKIGK